MKRVLICTSDKDTRRSLKIILDVLQCVVVQTTNAETALQLLEDNQDFDLLITSMKLPGTDGKELIKLLRKCGPFGQIPVIVTSGPVKLNVVEELLELGAAYFIPEPVKSEPATQYISRVLFGAAKAA